MPMDAPKPDPILRSLSVQCDSAEDIASHAFSHKVTREADRVIQQLHVFAQLQHHDKAEIQSLLSELLDLTRRNTERADRWEALDRVQLDRSVGGSVLSLSPQPRALEQHGIERAVGRSVVSASPQSRVLEKHGVERAIGRSVVSASPQPQVPEQYGVERAVGRSVISSPGSYAAKDVMTSPGSYMAKNAVDRSVGGSILQSAPPTPRGLVDRSIGGSVVMLASTIGEPVQQTASPSAVAVVPASPPKQQLDPQAILLTPPPNEPLSPDSMTDGMSYLSSHYSDELELQDARSPLLTRVSPSWEQARSERSIAVSSDYDSEDESGLTTPPGSVVRAVRHVEASPSIQQGGRQSIALTPVLSQVALAQSTEAAEILVENCTTTAVTKSPLESAMPSASLSIQMPVPVRAGEPFDGQLAEMLKEGSPSIAHALERADKACSVHYKSEIGETMDVAVGESVVGENDNRASPARSQLGLGLGFSPSMHTVRVYDTRLQCC